MLKSIIRKYFPILNVHNGTDRRRKLKEWWNHKFAPIPNSQFATATHLDVAISNHSTIYDEFSTRLNRYAMPTDYVQDVLYRQCSIGRYCDVFIEFGSTWENLIPTDSIERI